MELELFCVKLFNESKNIRDKRYVCLDIIDILLEYNVRVGERLVNELRSIERIEVNNLNRRNIIVTENVEVLKPKIIRTIYDDSQNVHTTEINNSVKECVKKLMSWYNEYRLNNIVKTFEEIKNYFLTKYVDEIIISVLDRIAKDISTFNIDISLKEVFVCLNNWIIINENREELERILVDEMFAMNGYCATGYLSRMINVLQGFSEDFMIKISIKEQCNSVVSNYLNKKLSECDDNEVIDGMILKGDKYIDFVRECISGKIDEWINEYGLEFGDNINIVVSKFIL
jgi:hypothetical protein